VHNDTLYNMKHDANAVSHSQVIVQVSRNAEQKRETRMEPVVVQSDLSES
jgi:hypothetical protein